MKLSNVMGMALIFLSLALYMKGSGCIIRLMGKGHSGIRVGISILGNSFKTQHMDMGFIFIPMGRITRVNGSKIRKMVMEKRSGKMDKLMKGAIKMVSKMATESINGLITVFSRATGKTT